MKNIYLLPTGESRLSLNRSYRDFNVGTEAGEPYWIYSDYKHFHSVTDSSVRPHHMYITNDEKFIGDEYITDGIEVIKSTPKLVEAQGLVNRRNWRKIILTTDPKLIEDGIQSIPDEFLEWFVKNPSCDKVVVTPYLKDIINSLTNEKYPVIQHRHFDETKMICTYDYELIIPKEEPKQETLEEVSERLYPTTIDSFTDTGIDMSETERLIFINGAKWQQEQDKNKYSEEEVKKLLLSCKDIFGGTDLDDYVEDSKVIKWFEQIKKK